MPPPLPQRGLGVTSSAPQVPRGPPQSQLLLPPGLGGRAPPGFRSGAGSDGRARKQLSPRRGRSKCHPGHLARRAGLVPVPVSCRGCPPFQAAPPRGGAGSTPRAAGLPRGRGTPAPVGSHTGDRDGGVTGVAGGDTAPTIYLGASTAPPAAQMSPRASRSGYRLRLQLPFIAPLPVPCPSSLSPPHRPPPPGWGQRHPSPQDTASYRGCPTPDTRTGDGGDPAVTLGGFVTHRGCPGVAPAAGCPLDTRRVTPMGAPTRPFHHAGGAGGRPEPHGDLHIKYRLICILRTVS